MSLMCAINWYWNEFFTTSQRRCGQRAVLSGRTGKCDGPYFFEALIVVFHWQKTTGTLIFIWISGNGHIMEMRMCGCLWFKRTCSNSSYWCIKVGLSKVLGVVIQIPVLISIKLMSQKFLIQLTVMKYDALQFQRKMLFKGSINETILSVKKIGFECQRWDALFVYVFVCLFRLIPVCSCLASLCIFGTGGWLPWN